MKAYELLSINKKMLDLMASMSIDISDLKYLELYSEYTKLLDEGHKKTYIMQYLSEEYGASERTIYRVIDRLSAEVII